MDGWREGRKTKTGENCPVWNYRLSATPGLLPKKIFQKITPSLQSHASSKDEFSKREHEKKSEIQREKKREKRGKGR